MRKTYRGIKIDDAILYRFLGKVAFTSRNTCWLWTAGKDSSGYGMMGVRGKTIYAHRFMMWYVSGEDRSGFEVSHRCDVRMCVNPTHLQWKTHSENIRDCVSKGRTYDRRGEGNPMARLDRRHVKAIREMHSSGVFPYSKIMKIFEIGKTTVSHVVRHSTWRNV